MNDIDVYLFRGEFFKINRGNVQYPCVRMPLL